MKIILESEEAWKYTVTGPSVSAKNRLGSQAAPFVAQNSELFGLESSGKVPGDGSSIVIATLADIVTARQQGRRVSEDCGFSGADCTIVATIVSELARNIVLYAKQGEIMIVGMERDGRKGIAIIGRDEGPGITNVERALLGGYSTSGGLGLGLYGVKRISDEFKIETGADKGTVVTVKNGGTERWDIDASLSSHERAYFQTRLYGKFRVTPSPGEDITMFITLTLETNHDDTSYFAGRRSPDVPPRIEGLA